MTAFIIKVNTFGIGFIINISHCWHLHFSYVCFSKWLKLTHSGTTISILKANIMNYMQDFIFKYFVILFLVVFGRGMLICLPERK